MFLDEAVIYVRSGKGGDGMMHFRQEKYVPRGGPDGGDGGRGASVILRVESRLNSLSSFHQNARFNADNGGNGGPSKMTGRSATALEILVPPGTIVYDAQSGELLGDLVTPDQTLVVAKGGRGGRGNIHFASSRNQAPRTAERGEPGEERKLRLELKLIADVGIVGVPNAGKSSLLSVVSNAKPKIAPYPFTTIEPNLGVAELDDDTSLVLADIPGLIEGAHQGVGLGDAFLRHIQRTRVIIHMLDGLAEDPIADFSQINSELALFDAQLADKPQVVVLNKMDLPEVQERWPEIKAALEAHGVVEPMAISAIAHGNLDPLLWRVKVLLDETPMLEVMEDLPVYRPAEDPREFTIAHVSDGWQVQGRAIERAAEMTYWEHEGSVRRFQRLLNALGIDDALRKAGVKPGDTVYVGDFELEWAD